jgi:hypothetical protein
MRKAPRLFCLFFSLLITGILGSCGIDKYSYLVPVDPGIPLIFNTQAFIRLPGGQDYTFQYYIIYYRIYISGSLIEGTVSIDQLAQVNSSLSADYNAFLPYITNTTDDTVVPGNVGNMFSNRKYYSLALEPTTDPPSSNPLLNDGGFITLDFARNNPPRPVLFAGDIRINPSLTPVDTLLRYSESGIMSPYPDRYFTNSTDLNDGIDASTFTNLDVATNSVSGYAYVSMYIVAYGLDDNYSPIYSTPTFIGVFRLPD